MLSLLRASVLVGISTIGTILAGLVRAKLTASWLGRSGLGVLSQSQNVALLISGLSSMGIGTGLLAMVSRARSRGDRQEVAALVDSSILIVGVPSLIALLGGVLGIAWLAPLAFGTASLRKLALISAIVGGVAQSVTPIPAALLYGYGHVRAYVISTLVSTFIGLPVLIALMYFFGLSGALIHVAVGPIITTAVVCIASQRILPAECSLAGRWPLRPNSSALRQLGAYVVSTGAAGLTYYIAQVSTRGLVLHRFGTVANGTLQVAVAIGSYLKQIITGGISADLFPSASQQDQTSLSLTALVRSGERFFLVIAVPGSVIIALFGHFIIHFLYTREFVDSAVPLLGTYLIGDVFRLLALVPTLVLSAQKRLFAATLPSVLGEGWFLLFFYLFPGQGLDSFINAYIAGGILSFWVATVAARRTLALSLGIFYSSSVTALLLLVALTLPRIPDDFLLRAAIAAGLIVAAWTWGLLPNERAALLRRLPLFGRN